MAKKVTQDDIIQFNILYYKYKTYAAVARETGFSASTVSRYIDKNFKPIEKTNVKKFDGKIPEDYFVFRSKENWGLDCDLSEEEKEEIKELWNELII